MIRVFHSIYLLPIRIRERSFIYTFFSGDIYKKIHQRLAHLKLNPSMFASLPQCILPGSPFLKLILGIFAYILNQIFSDIKVLIPVFLVLNEDPKTQIKMRGFAGTWAGPHQDSPFLPPLYSLLGSFPWCSLVLSSVLLDVVSFLLSISLVLRREARRIWSW